jgi:hypothetical protein
VPPVVVGLVSFGEVSAVATWVGSQRLLLFLSLRLVPPFPLDSGDERFLASTYHGQLFSDESHRVVPLYHCHRSQG